jgi:uncharacterized protein
MRPKTAPTFENTGSTSQMPLKMFRGLLIADPDTRADYGEDRWQGLGTIGGRVVQIVFAIRAPETIRIISLRKATSRERKEYEKTIQNGL